MAAQIIWRAQRAINGELQTSIRSLMVKAQTIISVTFMELSKED
jgi:hypothetical protein